MSIFWEYTNNLRISRYSVCVFICNKDVFLIPRSLETTTPNRRGHTNTVSTTQKA